MARPITIEPLSAAAFAPFGQVIALDGTTHYPINNGMTERYHDLARIELGGVHARPLLSLFRGQPYALPLSLTLVERHPLGSQAFIPLLGNPFLIVVAPLGDVPESELARAFISNGRQGVNYHRGVWHHPVLTIEKRDDFLVVDRSGSGNNCDEHFFEEDQMLVLDPHF